MEKKLKIALGKGFSKLSLVVGQRVTKAACFGPYYQGKVPEKMKRQKQILCRG